MTVGAVRCTQACSLPVQDRATPASGLALHSRRTASAWHPPLLPCWASPTAAWSAGALRWRGWA